MNESPPSNSPNQRVDSSEEENAVVTAAHRGPLRIHCRECGVFKRAKSVPIPRSKDNGHRRFNYVQEPDIAWFRRKRICGSCGTEFLTAEVDERLIEELLRHRQKQTRRRRTALSKVSTDVRTKKKWLASTGDKIPRELAAQLVSGSAWWLTHSSGSPVRAPRHADRLYELYCGWCVDFGANSFAAARALALARDYAKTIYPHALLGKLPTKATIQRNLRSIPSRCVLNVNGDFYDHYPENGASELVFGAQAIDVNDCERLLLRLTGLEDLLEAHAKIDKEE